MRKNVARVVVASAVALSLLIPSGMAFAVEKRSNDSTEKAILESSQVTTPPINTKDALTPSLPTTPNPPAINLESLLTEKRNAEAQAAEEEVDAQPSAEEIRQQTITSVIDTALSLQGVPYWYGGTTPSGFDCSGFTQYVFSQTGAYELPRTAAEQSYCGTPVSFDELSAGDLIFWGSGSGVYHTGIYIGDWSYIHADCDLGITVASMDSFTPSFAMRIL